MKNLFYASLLLFIVSCGSAGNKSDSLDSSENRNATKGNSAGSNVIKMDTMHMDTSGQNISIDSPQH